MEICSKQSVLDCPADVVETVVRQALDQEGRDADLSVALVGDQEMTELNRRFLGRDAVTDVLAFPYETRGAVITGEIVVNAELAVRQAAERSHGAVDELLLYVVHGLLHLLGYDDGEAEDARRMSERERAILKASGHAVES
ncbi:MAG: rRNA maturation RNase YbeY [Planctomycetota bacterium]|jgi:probable rRNA maturation factor